MAAPRATCVPAYYTHLSQPRQFTQTSDKVEWVKFSGISWLHDDSGFFYSRYPEPKSFSDKSVADDVEADDVKRGSETDSNLNMAIYFRAWHSPSPPSFRPSPPLPPDTGSTPCAPSRWPGHSTSIFSPPFPYLQEASFPPPR